MVPAQGARKFHDLLRTAVAERSTKLDLPPGDHRITGNLLPDQLLWISNHDGGCRTVLFDCTGASDLVIDGHGCRLLIEGNVIPFLLRNCRNLTLRNIAIDWIRPGFTEVEVTASGAGFVEFDGGGQLDVDRGRLVAVGGGSWPSSHLFNMVAFDKKRREPLAGSAENWNLERTHRARRITGELFRLEGDLDFPPPPGGPAVLMHGDRVAPAVVIDRSENIVLEDVTIHHALGMGVIAQTSKDLTWRRLRVVPSGDRLFSTWVDATHAVDCSGYLKIEDCEFRGMFDDGTNIHGVYHRVVEWLTPRRVLMEAPHHQQWGIAFLQPGDVCRLSDPITLNPIATERVAEVVARNARFQEIEFESSPAIERQNPCVIHRYDPVFKVEISGTRICQNRGRGMLLSHAGKTHVRNNFLHCSGTAILVAPDAHYWWESGPAGELVIDGNEFDGCGYAMCGEHVLTLDSPPGPVPLHGRVVFTNNRVQAARPVLINAPRVANLEIANNRIERHPNYPWQGDWTPLVAEGSPEVHSDLPNVL